MKFECKCGGTGFVIVVGDYRVANGTVKKKIRIAQRCPEYKRYFRDLGGMTSYLVDALINRDGCPAAIDAHLIIKRIGEKKEEDQRSHYGK